MFADMGGLWLRKDFGFLGRGFWNVGAMFVFLKERLFNFGSLNGRGTPGARFCRDRRSVFELRDFNCCFPIGILVADWDGRLCGFEGGGAAADPGGEELFGEIIEGGDVALPEFDDFGADFVLGGINGLVAF